MVVKKLEASVISAVNWSEVIQKSLARGANTVGMSAEFRALGLTVAPLDVNGAEMAASLSSATSKFGLSLADRCCLALARQFDVPVLTTDRLWSRLQIGVRVELIR